MVEVNDVAAVPIEESRRGITGGTSLHDGCVLGRESTSESDSSNWETGWSTNETCELRSSIGRKEGVRADPV